VEEIQSVPIPGMRNTETSSKINRKIYGEIMETKENDAFINDFIETGNELYNSGKFSELAEFCNELLGVINDERVQLMLEHAESAKENATFNSDTKTFRHPNGYRITGYSNEFIINSIFFMNGYFEQELLERWFIKGNYKTIFDIGANIGNHTLFFASNSPDAEIYSFEPMPVNYKLLETNIYNNQLGNRVYLYNKAVGSKIDKLRMKINHKNNYGTAKITDETGSDLVTVEVVKIDDLDLPVPDFVKIDTEGYEIQVLEGMKETLKKSEAFVWIEISEENAVEVYQIMKSLDFDVIDISLRGNTDILFGKSTQVTYPIGYAFGRLINWSKDMHKKIEMLHTITLSLRG